MGKKAKLGVGEIIGTAYGVANNVGLVPDANDLYSVGKDVLVGAKGEIEKNIKQNKINQLLFEIGDRVIKKNIIINDKDIEAEIECIKDLEADIKKLITSPAEK